MQEKETLSITDRLTGAINRRGFDEQLAALTIPNKRAYEKPLSLIMIDVDHFKSVNDTLGHPAGDLVLSGLGKMLQDHLRTEDMLARFGGEEFMALLPGCPLQDALQVAEKLRAAIEAHDFGIDRKITASLGVAQWENPQPPEALLAIVDARLYEAKSAGRNCVMPVTVPVVSA